MINEVITDIIDNYMNHPNIVEIQNHRKSKSYFIFGNLRQIIFLNLLVLKFTKIY